MTATGTGGRRWMSVLGAIALVLPALVGVIATPADASLHVGVGLVDPATGVWHLHSSDGSSASFYFGNPGDYPIVGDWDCDGIDTPGMYRQADGYVYLRNSNTQGNADIRFFFGNPGDVPLAGDFNGDGCDTVSIYRPLAGQFFVINALGANEGGLGAAEFDYYFGNPGDKPFVGDFDGDGTDEIGLHRESTGFMYFRLTHTQGVADTEFFFGDPDDRCLAGDWTGDGTDTPAIFRPGDTTFYFRFTNTQGNANLTMRLGEHDWLPVSGDFGHLVGGTAPPPPPTYSPAAVDYFAEVAIGHDPANDWYDQVWKWAADVRTVAVGSMTAGDQATVAAVAGDINRAAATVQLRLGSYSPEATDMAIIYTPSATFPDLLSWTSPTSTLAWSVLADGATIRSAVILIASDTTTQLQRDVMVRYAMGAAVGVMGTSARYPDSVFHDDWVWTTTSFAPIDEEVIALLYDPRVLPGMNEAQVRAAIAGGRAAPAPAIVPSGGGEMRGGNR